MEWDVGGACEGIFSIGDSNFLTLSFKSAQYLLPQKMFVLLFQQGW